MNAQNEAAYESVRSDLFNNAFTGITDIGDTLMKMGQVGQLTGYSAFGDYLNKADKGKKKGRLKERIQLMMKKYET